MRRSGSNRAATRRYAPFWCEENAVRLARRLGLEGRSIAFITNEDRMTAFANQRAGDGELRLALWDYHVVVVDHAVGASSARVWDQDSTRGMPLPLEAWVDATFSVLGELSSALPPLFRVVDATECSAVFASDRSHMRHQDGSYQKPPPPWRPLGAGANNLPRFLALDDPFIGALFDLEGFVLWGTSSAGARVGRV